MLVIIVHFVKAARSVRLLLQCGIQCVQQDTRSGHPLSIELQRCLNVLRLPSALKPHHLSHRSSI